MNTLNNPVAGSYVRAPRLRVMLGTIEIPGAISASVTSNNWYLADSFRVEFALNADPAFGFAWWGAQSDMLLDVQIGIATERRIDGLSMIQGAVDHIEISPEQGTVSVSGNDLTARFVETKLQETFANQTSSQIATTLAGRHNMTADVDATTTLAGAYWQQDHVNSTLGQFSRMTTEWDLLTNLARREGFDLYVTGTVLHFKEATSPDATPYLVRWVPPRLALGAAFGRESNVNNLRCERALTLARDIEVVVESFHSKTGKSFKKSARAIGAKSSSAAKAANQTGFASNTQRFVYSVPNLTEDEALKRAQSLLADLSKHERVISWQSPGDLTLHPRNLVRLEGTGTDFDQTYFIDSIERSISFDQGFAMHVRAKNRDARSQAAHP